MRIRTIPVFFVFALLCHSVYADFQKPQISKVPLYRLVVNLEKMKQEDPKDPHNYYALGRLYCMAYAKKEDEIEAVIHKGDNEFSPYYGIEQNMPNFFQVKEARDSSKIRFGKECLERAESNFRESLNLDSTYLPARLGLAWTLDQLGNKEEAKIRYREILQITEKQEKNKYTTIETEETAGYLIPLLDPEKDKEEISRLQERRARFKPNYLISPIVFPLEDVQEFETLIAKEPVKFDLDASGIPASWEWINEKAGWLVYRKGNEKIENAMQLFGNRSFNIFWSNGFDAMRSLDDNQDGKLSGTELKNLSVWVDLNFNGKSEDNEFKDLEVLEVKELHFTFEKESDRLFLSKGGIQFKNGRSRNLYDWYPSNKNAL